MGVFWTAQRWNEEIARPLGLPEVEAGDYLADAWGEALADLARRIRRTEERRNMHTTITLTGEVFSRGQVADLIRQIDSSIQIRRGPSA